MRCDEIRERLGVFLDAELPRAEAAKVREHLASCPSCASELDELRSIAEALSPANVVAPQALWTSIEGRLGSTQITRTAPLRLRRRLRFAAAAIVALTAGAIGLGLLAVDRSASASELDFSVLLDGLPFDVNVAFARFVKQHGGEKSTPEKAQQFASGLNFAIPAELPGGFLLRDVFILRIGSQPGVAARYGRREEFLAAVFHPPVRREDFGSHKDYECVVGQHRGHAVAVDGWTMVHVTDPTTCHCVLSRLNESELPPILKAVAPELTEHPHP